MRISGCYLVLDVSSYLLEINFGHNYLVAQNLQVGFRSLLVVVPVATSAHYSKGYGLFQEKYQSQ